MKNTLTLFLLITGFLVIASGCDGDGGTKVQVPKVQMTLDTNNLEPLIDEYSYKAWVKIGDLYYGTEKFNVTETGQFLTQSGQFRNKTFALETDITDAEIVLISIEGKSSSDDEPSDTIVLAADVVGATSSLTTRHPAALNADVSNASGQLTIMTPSDIDLTNEAHGVWFLTVSGAVQSPSLSLPALNSGWVYESWVEVGGKQFSMGKLTSASGNDLGQAYSYPDVPLFPGEDFLINAPAGTTFPLILDGATVFITVEPDPDDNVAPYGIRILSVQLPSTVQGGTVHALSNAGVAPPTATVSIF